MSTETARFLPQFRRLVAGFPLLRLGFTPKSGHVELVDEAELRVLRSPLPVLIPPIAVVSLITLPSHAKVLLLTVSSNIELGKDANRQLTVN